MKTQRDAGRDLRPAFTLGAQPSATKRKTIKQLLHITTKAIFQGGNQGCITEQKN